MYLNVNHNVSFLVRPIHMPPTRWSFLNIDTVTLRVKIMSPKIFSLQQLRTGVLYYTSIQFYTENQDHDTSLGSFNR